MERYAIIIRPNEETVLLHCYPGDSLDLKALQEIVEGHIETVPRRPTGWPRRSTRRSSSTRRASCWGCR